MGVRQPIGVIRSGSRRWRRRSVFFGEVHLREREGRQGFAEGKYARRQLRRQHARRQRRARNGRTVAFAVRLEDGERMVPLLLLAPQLLAGGTAARAGRHSACAGVIECPECTGDGPSRRSEGDRSEDRKHGDGYARVSREPPQRRDCKSRPPHCRRLTTREGNAKQ